MDTQIEESIAGRKANNEAFYSALKEYKAYGRRGLASMDLEGLVDELVRRFPMTHTCADCGARYTEDEPERYAFLCFSCASHQYE